MPGFVDNYVNSVIDVLTDDARVFVEYHVDLSMYVPGCYGTADCAVVVGDTLHIFDLKYGKGVQVYADENPQLMMYALRRTRRNTHQHAERYRRSMPHRTASTVQPQRI